MTDIARVMVVDDEPAMLENYERLLRPEGYDVIALADPRAFRSVAGPGDVDVLISDLRMPGVDGMTILAASRADDAIRPVIIVTAFGSVASAVAAIREGAFDYLTKPFTADQLLVAVERAVGWRRLNQENRSLRERVTANDTGGILGGSAVMSGLLDQARRVAPTDANVLITGESGTGKELFARFLHARSRRATRPFMAVDCAALPEGLLESELFGHQRGAFTGAVQHHAGLFEQASRGTLFLDEIGEMTSALQSKLLRALEQRQIRRLGDTAVIDVDIRVIAATNVDLEQAVARGSFREDLYYRLNVVRFEIPPLRARDGDVPVLLSSFLQEFARKNERTAPQVAPDAWHLLERYTWPGNVRELRNLAQRLVVLDDDGVIARDDMPMQIVAPSPLVESEQAAPPGSPAYETAQAHALQRFRAGYVRDLLERCNGNVTRAAQAAGVSRRTFHRWMAEQRPSGAPEA